MKKNVYFFGVIAKESYLCSRNRSFMNMVINEN